MNGRLGRLLASRSVASGAVLYIAMRWFDRFVGVISTVVLARLLTPEDFGIVALASIVLGLAVVLLDLGINTIVVQRPTLDDDELNTAWSLRLIQNGLVAIALAASAPFAATQFNDERLETVLLVFAITYVIGGLTGMGPVLFQRERRYAQEVSFTLFKRLSGFLVTMILALWLRSYWALVLGSLVGNILGVLFSHAIRPLPVRFTLARWRQFIGASFWLTLRSIGSYASQQLDKLVIGSRSGTRSLGEYSIADQIAAMPTTELLAPMSRALFPAMAANQNNPAELKRQFNYALSLQATLALPASIGLALVAPDLVHVMLGEPWRSTAPLMTALALAYGANALTHSSSYLLVSLGKFQAQGLIQWGLAVLLALFIFVVSPDAGAIEIAWFRVVIAGVGIVTLTALALHILPALRLSDLAKGMLRPLSASLAMALVLSTGGSLMADFPAWLRLATAVAIGAIVYSVALYGLWRIVGRPAGAEQWLIDRLRYILAKRPRD